MSLNPQNEMEEVDGNTETERSPQEKAFTNFLVAEKIASYLHSIEDLRTFRIINRSCYDACLLTWRKKVSVCLDPDSEPTIEQFMENVYDIGSVEDYHVNLCSLPPVRISDEEVESNAQLRFWKECGPYMKHLYLEECEINENNLLNLVCNWTPNLESLKIEDCVELGDDVEPEESEHLKPNVNLKIFHAFEPLSFPTCRFSKYFPNLVELKLKQETLQETENPLYDLARREFYIMVIRECVEGYGRHTPTIAWRGSEDHTESAARAGSCFGQAFQNFKSRGLRALRHHKRKISGFRLACINFFRNARSRVHNHIF